MAAQLGNGIGEFHDQILILRRITHHDFQRKQPRLRQIQRLGRIHDDPVGERIIRITVQYLFSCRQRFSRIFSKRHFGFCELR